MSTHDAPPLRVWLCSLALWLGGIGMLWLAGEDLRQARLQAFVDTQAPRISDYVRQQRSTQKPAIVVMGNSLMRNAAPIDGLDGYPWLRVVYFDPTYLFQLRAVLAANPPDVLVLQNELLLPALFGDGITAFKRLQRYLREWQVILQSHAGDRSQRDAGLRQYMQRTQENRVECTAGISQFQALDDMSRRIRTFYRPGAIDPAALQAVRDLSAHTKHLILLDIPRSLPIEKRFGADIQAWHAKVLQQLGDLPRVRGARLSKSQPRQCYCDYMHIQPECRAPLDRAMKQLIRETLSPS